MLWIHVLLLFYSQSFTEQFCHSPIFIPAVLIYAALYHTLTTGAIWGLVPCSMEDTGIEPINLLVSGRPIPPCHRRYYCLSSYRTCRLWPCVILLLQSAGTCCYPWCCGSWAGHWPAWLTGLMTRGGTAWSCSTTFWRSSAGTTWWDT